MMSADTFFTGGRSSARADSASGALFPGHGDAGATCWPHEKSPATCCSASGVGADGRGGFTARSNNTRKLSTVSGGSLSSEPFFPKESTSLKSTTASTSMVPAPTTMTCRRTFWPDARGRGHGTKQLPPEMTPSHWS